MTRRHVHEKSDYAVGANKPLNDSKKVTQKPIIAIREGKGSAELVVIDESKRSCETYSVYRGEQKADKIVRAQEPMSTLLRSEVKQLVTHGAAQFGAVHYRVTSGEVAMPRERKQTPVE